MMEFIAKFIENNFGLSFLIGIIIVGAILSGVIWITIWCINLVSKNKSLAQTIGSLPCTEHRETITKHSDTLTKIYSSLGQIEGKVELLIRLSANISAKPAYTSDYSEKQSPRKLNINGEKLFAQVNGSEFLEENGDFLLNEIEKLNPKTALDVENLALTVLRGNSDNESYAGLKNWVYNAPVQEITNTEGGTVQKEVSLDEVLFVISIPLRDKYLSAHPDIKQ